MTLRLTRADIGEIEGGQKHLTMSIQQVRP